MLTLLAPQAETLWDELLPVQARQLPEDLARIDELLSDQALLVPIAEHWRGEAGLRGYSAEAHGRPTIAMETYVRLMVVKQRSGFGYETLVREVSDSLHLRRFCLIPLHERVPDESTVRKLTRRLGAEVVQELTRALIEKAHRERRFRARAVRIDSTVIEADVKYPTDAELAAHGVRALAREGGKLAQKIGQTEARVRDRSRALGRRLRAISRTLRRRSGQAKSEVLGLTAQTGELLERSVREARRLAVRARASARGPRAQASSARRPGWRAGRPLREGRRADQAAPGRRADHRPVDLARRPRRQADRKGKLGKPNEFGYVTQLAEVTENTRRGARGLILPAASLPGNPQEDTLLPKPSRSSRG